MTQLDDQPASHKFFHSFSPPPHSLSSSSFSPFAADCILSHNCVSGYVFIILPSFVYLIFLSLSLTHSHNVALLLFCVQFFFILILSLGSGLSQQYFVWACFQLILNSNSLILAIMVSGVYVVCCKTNWWWLLFSVIKFTKSLMRLYISNISSNNKPHSHCGFPWA